MLQLILEFEQNIQRIPTLNHKSFFQKLFINPNKIKFELKLSRGKTNLNNFHACNINSNRVTWPL